MVMTPKPMYTSNPTILAFSHAWANGELLSMNASVRPSTSSNVSIT